MPKRAEPTSKDRPVIDEILGQCTDITAELDRLAHETAVLRRRRRHLYLRAWKKGAHYPHIAEAVGVNEVSVYRQIVKARAETGG